MPRHWGNISDTWLFLRASLAGAIGYIAEPLCRYRVHQESISLGMYADGSLFRDHIRVAHEAFGWDEAAAHGLDRRKAEAMRGVVRNALRIAHLARLRMGPIAFARLVSDLAVASPGAMIAPGALARLAFCALPRSAIRAARRHRLRHGGWSLDDGAFAGLPR